MLALILKFFYIPRMQRFSKTDLITKVAQVFRATFAEPVIITDRNNDSHVLMTIERYKELISAEKDKEELE